jgi:crossover junction endodeoxyribonuclease RuvC
MRVIGIDPGLVRSGWAVVEPAGLGPLDLRPLPGAALGRVSVLAHGLIAPTPAAELPTRLADGGRQLRDVLRTYAPELASLEDIFTAPRHPRSALLMAHMRGVICLVLEEAGVPVLPLTATTVKQRLTGSGHASKQQIQRMVLRLTGIPAPQSMRWDESDALALALAGLSQTLQPRRGQLTRRISPAVLAAMARDR